MVGWATKCLGRYRIIGYQETGEKPCLLMGKVEYANIYSDGGYEVLRMMPNFLESVFTNFCSDLYAPYPWKFLTWLISSL